MSNFQTFIPDATQNSLAIHYKTMSWPKIIGRIFYLGMKDENDRIINISEKLLQMLLLAMNILYIFYKYVTIFSVFVLYEKKDGEPKKKHFRLGIFVWNREIQTF